MEKNNGQSMKECHGLERAMRVKDLIEELKKFDREAPVYLRMSDELCSCTLENVRIKYLNLSPRGRVYINSEDREEKDK